MGKSKEQLESDAERYAGRLYGAKAAESSGNFNEAIEHAREALEFVPGMMQYERKYEGACFETVEAVEIILRCAPIVLDSASLDDLERFLKNNRSVDRTASDDLAGKVQEARNRLRNAHRILDGLETVGTLSDHDLRHWTRNDDVDDQSLLEVWLKCGLLERAAEAPSAPLRLASRIDGPTRAKCSKCGAVARGAKLRFLTSVKCPACAQEVEFVILGGIVDE